MTRMIRKQVYITRDQDERLKRRAKETGISESELIRRGVDFEVETDNESRDLSEAAWEEAKRLIRKRMAMKVPQTGRSWTREELYEERLGRVSR